MLRDGNRASLENVARSGYVTLFVHSRLKQALGRTLHFDTNPSAQPDTGGDSKAYPISNANALFAPKYVARLMSCLDPLQAKVALSLRPNLIPILASFWEQRVL